MKSCSRGETLGPAMPVVMKTDVHIVLKLMPGFPPGTLKDKPTLQSLGLGEHNAGPPGLKKHFQGPQLPNFPNRHLETGTWLSSQGSPEHLQLQASHLRAFLGQNTGIISRSDFKSPAQPAVPTTANLAESCSPPNFAFLTHQLLTSTKCAMLPGMLLPSLLRHN